MIYATNLNILLSNTYIWLISTTILFGVKLHNNNYTNCKRVIKLIMVDGEGGGQPMLKFEKRWWDN